MVHYVVTREHAYTMEPYVEGWDGLRLLFYDDLFHVPALPAGAYVFTDQERLTPSEHRLAASIWDQLAVHASRVRLLNDPRRVLDRYELLTELARVGWNSYRVWRPTDDLSAVRFPAFVRAEREHTGALTPLLPDAAALRRALLRVRLHGYRAAELLVVEFCDTSRADGLFRKYSAFVVGDRVLPRHLFVSANWHLKKPDRDDPATAREQDAYLETNPHREALRRLFGIAGIGYGRADYSTMGESLQVWEINTNPTQLRMAERLTEAFAALDVPADAREEIAISLDPMLLLAAAREARARRRVLRQRELVEQALASPLARSLRRATRLLRNP